MLLETSKIHGVNLGGWLMMEGYILGGRNIAETKFKTKFKSIYGGEQLLRFERSFRNNFIVKDDFKNIHLMGANTVRVPFNYRLIEEKPYKYSNEGFSYLDKIFSWAEQYKIKVILDLHAACGSQNCDWHSDSNGKARLWTGDSFRERTYLLWEAIVDRFKDRSSLLGFDLLNEPVIQGQGVKKIKVFYQKLIKRIRVIDKSHVIFLEGDLWAQRIDFLRDLIGEKISISIHSYWPLDYVFNYSPFYKFPGKIKGDFWGKKTIRKCLEPYYKFSQRNKVGILVGEFGINWRGGFWGELDWLKAILKAFNDFGFGYTYWTYKAIANSVFPDGIYQKVEDSVCINRSGVDQGLESYFNLWGKGSSSMPRFWKTKGFTPNAKIIGVLKEFFKK